MPMKKAPFYTQAGLAAKAGVVRSTVAKAIAAGRLAAIETLDGVPVVAVEDAHKWLSARGGGENNGRKTPSGGRIMGEKPRVSVRVGGSENSQ
jgi:hypothetical protein